MLNPFTPAETVSRSVTGTTARVTLPTTAHTQIMVTSPVGGSIAFIKFGTSTIEAAVTDIPILPGAIMVFSVSATHVAAIGTSGTTLYFTSGYGD